MIVKFGDKIIGEVVSFEIVDKEYPKVEELNLKDGYCFVSGELSFNIPIKFVEINGVVVGSHNNDK
jgi:hypothetical protein